MDAEYWRTMFDYGYWARDRLFAAMAGLAQEEFERPTGFSFGSLRAVLTHCLDTEYGWRCRLDGGRDEGVLSESQVPDFEALRRRWAEEEARTRAYLSQDVDPAGEVTYTGKSEEAVTLPRWHILAHIANHSAQHRSDVAEALTKIGRSPGNLDVMLYFQEQRS